MSMQRITQLLNEARAYEEAADKQEQEARSICTLYRLEAERTLIQRKRDIAASRREEAAALIAKLH
jgi:hypothetical protein